MSKKVEKEEKEERERCGTREEFKGGTMIRALCFLSLFLSLFLSYLLPSSGLKECFVCVCVILLFFLQQVETVCCRKSSFSEMDMGFFSCTELYAYHSNLYITKENKTWDANLQLSPIWLGGCFVTVGAAVVVGDPFETLPTYSTHQAFMAPLSSGETM